MTKKLKIRNGSIKILNEYENYTYFSIRKYLAHLTSESILFPKSIYYNITFGMNEQLLNENKDEISQHIIKYMNILNMNSFVPDIKSKNSKKMSKGQTQRIAIIRLFINIIFDNIKIVFLDEFTSNIDNEMEIIIFNELLQLQSKFHLTIFFISHNMFNMKYSDFNYKFNVDERSITKYITKKDDILCVQ
jgi:ABC-type transport system involved in cytochrome bd biosynthesis fused ATPase/permease subunit